MQIKALEVIYLVVYVGTQTLHYYMSEKQIIYKLLMKSVDPPAC